MLRKKPLYYTLILISITVLIISSIPVYKYITTSGSSEQTLSGMNGQMPQNGERPEMGDIPDDGERPSGGGFSDGETSEDGELPGNGEMPDNSTMQEAMEIIQEADGDITDEVKQKLYDLGLTDDEIDRLSNMGNGGQMPDNNQMTVDAEFPIVPVILIALSLFVIIFSMYRIHSISKSSKNRMRRSL